ncbi:MAG: carboxypeptidase-like regulatory domain-containing protein [Vicingaceae bacterium]
MHKKFLYLIVLLLFSVALNAQFAYVKGTLKDASGNAIEGANVVLVGFSGGTTTDKNGKFSIKIPANTDVVLAITHINFNTVKQPLNLKENETFNFSPELTKKVIDLSKFNVVATENTRPTTMTKIQPRLVKSMPTPSDHFEAILKTLPGVASNNELSSQYSVRGGNFDENLVYVNDIEIYRPFLIRSGQQEGLSFINSDLIESIAFSAGGFEARYGDKMSSVLDIQYKEPLDFEASATLSLQGASFHIEGPGLERRLTHITGVRYKSNQYVLKSLDTQGQYKPNFLDAQTYITYDISEKWQMGFLGNVARNVYNFIPENRKTEFGTINEALQLTIFFDGQEKDRFETYFGAITNTFKPKHNVELKFITSAFKSLEDEAFDIEGAYRIDELERDLGSSDFGEVSFNRGVGLFINHARNQLDATVLNFEQKGKITHEKHTTYFGLKYQHEFIKDRLSEWDYVDSAGFSFPHPADSVGYTNPSLQPVQLLELQQVHKTNIAISSNRFNTYLQRNWRWMNEDSVFYTFSLGVRGAYWDFNKEFLFSPRASFSFQPNWKHDYLFRLSGGIYYQPPFYKELRGFDGIINNNLKSQRSYHAVLGSDHNFKAWNRPFKFVTELYYKYIENVIPYKVENVRIRYFAKNNARAYATGIDFKVNGEFVKGIESWFSLSLMQTQEDILDDYYYDYYNADGEKIIPGYTLNTVAVDSQRVEPGYIPRPTDQRVNVGLFFQDHLPNNENFKMHLALFYGTALPFGPPNNFDRYKDTLRMPPYRRVDIGFSVLLKSEDKKVKPASPFKHFKSIWLSAEVFNLLQINNTISYLWVMDVTGRQYAVPNYLTNRQINVKLHFRF